MNRKLLSVAGLLIAALLFVAVNVLSNATLRNARLDLTENRLYTLSQGTRNVLSGIEEPITLRLFYSEKLANQVPQVKTYGERVRELLEEYAARSRGRIRLEVIDPEPFSDAEDRAVQAGLQGVPLDQASGRQFYFGLQGSSSTDRQEVIPFFQQEKEQFLEYDLTKLVYNLTDPKKPVLAILSDLPLEYGAGGMMAAMRGQSQPYALLNQLRSLFEVRLLKPDLSEIGADVKVLLLAHPKSLSDQALYAIDQFVLRGGRALVFVDPLAETDAGQGAAMGMPNPGESKSSDLPKLFQAWGLELEPGRFVADRRLAIRVNAGEGRRQSVVDYVAWLQLGPDNRNRSDVVTGEIGTLNLATAGRLKPRDGATTRFEPLLSSSDQAQLMDVQRVRFRPDPEGLLADFKPSGERYTLAARITGPARTAFPDGPPPPPASPQSAAEPKIEPAAATQVKPAAAQVMESAMPINVIVVADTDMLEDRLWVRVQDFFGQKVAVPLAANGDLVVNAVDNLSGSNDLISLRSRGRSTRPFEAVEELRRNASQQFLAQEKALQQKLEQAEKQITELQSKNKGGSGKLLSAEEQSAIDGFRQEMVRTRRELRDVQHNLNKDIERLATGIKFANIGLVPLLIALLALALAGLRRRRRRLRVVQH